MPWPAEELEQLGSRRYVSEAGDDGAAPQDPQDKLDRWERADLLLGSLVGPACICMDWALYCMIGFSGGAALC